MSGEKVSFGEYIEAIRKLRQKSLRKTAQAIGISPQFYSEVEKGRRPAFTADRLEMLKNFLQLTPEESEQMYNKAAESHTKRNVAVPQDFTNYIVEREYVMTALRTMKNMDAGEDDWKRMVEDFIKHRKEKPSD